VVGNGLRDWQAENWKQEFIFEAITEVNEHLNCEDRKCTLVLGPTSLECA